MYVRIIIASIMLYTRDIQLFSGATECSDLRVVWPRIQEYPAKHCLMS